MNNSRVPPMYIIVGMNRKAASLTVSAAMVSTLLSVTGSAGGCHGDNIMCNHDNSVSIQ